MGATRFRVFISSPDDVREERVLANKLVLRLADEFADRLTIEPVFWEHEPLPATDTYQASIPRASECQVFVCILWSRLGTPLPARFARADGTRYDSGTEFEYEDAFEGHARNGFPVMLVYRKSAKFMADMSDEAALMQRVGQKRALDRFIKKWLQDERDGSDRASCSFATAVQFEELLAEHLRKLIERRLPEIPTGDRPAKLSWKTGSPFRGLEVFDFAHAGVFFGRSRAVGEVLAALRQQATDGRAFVLVLGASGTGKSSLVQAGVLPLLTQPGVIEGVKLWRRAIVTPGSAGGDLFTALASALVQENALPELATDGTPMAELVRRLRDPPAVFPLVKGALSQVAALLARDQPLGAQPEVRLALVVDQLEEMFTGGKITGAERKAFVQALSSLARSGRVWVLATLRSDFYHRCAELDDLVALKEGAGQYDLLLPTMAEIGQMIRQPAQAAGLWFEQEESSKTTLDHALQAAASANPESLPLLEFALQELYKRRTAQGALTWQAYRELGGVEGALATRAENVFAALPPEVQAMLPKVFRQLVSVRDEDGSVSRKSATMESFASPPSCRLFVDAFVAARLFTTDRAADGSAAVRVAHEALLRRNWPRLTAWLDDNREMLRVRDRVKASALRWEREKRPSDLLLPEGKPLEEAQSLLNAFSTDSDLSETDRAFIRDSATSVARWALIKRFAVASLAGLTVIAVVAAAVAFWQRNQAQLNQQQADHNALVADQNANQAKQNAADAKLKLADGQVDQGDALALVGRCDAARDSLVRAHLLFQELGLPAVRANLVLWNLYLDSPPELMTLAGHADTVNSVAYSPDGRRVLSGSADNTLKLWDVVSGQEIRTFSGHSLPVKSVCFSADGERALSGAADNTLRLWDTRLGTELKTFRGHTGGVLSVCLSQDGHRALSGAEDRTVRLWDTDNGKELRRFTGHTESVNCVAFSPDGQSALSGSADRTLKWWNLVSGKETTLAEHTSPVASVAFSSDGRAALSASWDNTLKQWDLASAKVVKTVSGPNVGIIHAVFSVDGLRALSADSQAASASGSNATLTLWDLETGKVVRTFSAYADQVASVALSPDGRTALSGSADRSVNVWDLDAGSEMKTLVGHKAGVTSVALSPDSQTVLSGSADKTLKLWDLETGKELRTFAGHTGKVTSVAFAHDGRRALSGSWDNTMKLWDVDTGKTLMTFPGAGEVGGHEDLVTGVAFSPDGHTALSGSEDRVLKQWDLASGKNLKTFSGHLSGITSIALSADGQTVLSGSTDTRAKLWDLESGKELQTFSGHTSTVMSVAFSPDGRTILTGSADKTAKWWDRATGKELRTFTGHHDKVTSVAFAPDGLIALSGSEDHRAKLWDLTSGKELRTLPGHVTGVTSVALSLDGRVALTGSWDKTIKVWDFRRADRYIEFSRSLRPIQAGLARNPPDPAALALMGSWYAFRGVDLWALELLEKARSEGADVPSLTLARCCWKLGRLRQARQEFQRALERQEAPVEYLAHCLQALEKADTH